MNFVSGLQIRVRQLKLLSDYILSRVYIVNLPLALSNISYLTAYILAQSYDGVKIHVESLIRIFGTAFMVMTIPKYLLESLAHPVTRIFYVKFR